MIGITTGVVLVILGFFIASVIVNQRRYIRVQQEKLAESRRVEEILRDMPQHILQAQEDARSRIARDLHDGINQMLASIRYRLHSLTTRASDTESTQSPSTVNRESVEHLLHDLEQTMDEVKRISHNLHPKLFDDLGFVPAVRELCDEFSDRTHVNVRCGLSNMPSDLPKEIGLALFRISQEALQNVEQHAHAKNVTIDACRDADSYLLTICDDGKGCNGNHSNAMKQHRSIGLKTMKERAALIGGSLDIRSIPDHGTTISVRFPAPTNPVIHSG
jgi:two-component system NarL family sensor kinase